MERPEALFSEGRWLFLQKSTPILQANNQKTPFLLQLSVNHLISQGTSQEICWRMGPTFPLSREQTGLGQLEMGHAGLCLTLLLVWEGTLDS